MPNIQNKYGLVFSKGLGISRATCRISVYKRSSCKFGTHEKVEGWNYTSVEVAIAIVENYKIDSIASEYKPYSNVYVKIIILRPSDCFFIATTTDEEFLERRRVGNTARLDLSHIMNGERNAQ